jgi:hypothetical protein
MPFLPLLILAVVLLAAVSKNGRRFLSGEPLDGQRRTNATFRQHPTKALHPTADRSWWHWRPGWHRGAARVAAVTVIAALGYGFMFARVLTVFCLALCAGIITGYAAWKLQAACRSWIRACAWDRDHRWKSLWAALILPWQHHVYYRQPLKYAVAAELGVPALRVKVPLDRSRAAVHLPHDFTGSDKGQEGLTRAVTTKLALEAPEASWKLHGRRPRVTFTLCDPPPTLVTWEDVVPEIEAAAHHELLTGIGRRDATVRVSLEDDSPHFGVIAGTGGGKSNLAAFWLLQELRRGAIALILDSKRFSHPWTYKDMNAEYGLLPNVGYCRSLSDLHDGMVWLGEELERRNGVAERAINAKGDVLADVGPRLFIIAEEMNLAHGPLKQYWAANRGKDQPKKSPAFTGLGAVSFAGRAVRMHLVVIGQMLKAEVLGGGDVRENIGVRMLTRYTQNSWKMQAGDIPMPPPTRQPGRWQCLASGEVTETQVPWIDMEQARELAVSGVVTPCPAGMPGRAGAMSVPPSAPSQPGSDLQVVVGQSVEVTVGLTIREAIDDGVFGPLSLEAARRRVHRAKLRPNGQRGDGSYTYDRAALFAAAGPHRKEIAR